MPQAAQAASTPSAAKKNTAHQPTGGARVAPKKPMEPTTFVVRFAHNPKKSQPTITSQPTTILQTRIAGLRRIDSKNGSASTSPVTNNAASSLAEASPPGNQKPAITAGKSSNLNNCVTAKTTKTAAKLRLIKRILLVFGDCAVVGWTKKLMATV